jgi:hypothetical protein
MHAGGIPRELTQPAWQVSAVKKAKGTTSTSRQPGYLYNSVARQQLIQGDTYSTLLVCTTQQLEKNQHGEAHNTAQRPKLP